MLGLSPLAIGRRACLGPARQLIVRAAKEKRPLIGPAVGAPSPLQTSGIVLFYRGNAVPKILEVNSVEPAALSPKGAAEYLSLSLRSVSNLIADRVLIAKQAGGRTLVDFQSVKKYYEALPVKTVGVSIPNAPQVSRRTACKSRKASARARVSRMVRGDE